ncbi:uncharacterized protein N7515_006386 [Penicillium bovifimosum]|uniref:Uncharacterized protein n=1 Tax=Penicillium bovifimosum TaxID=126998 RepID=A0A9W9GUM0_9EURO|nr:uncharacterized protein N7515_006386 [Penicillium bovifimosum]KAJ5130347.1 hypothetical protein N7515_006386 [Penicillium bovifimosum]
MGRPRKYASVEERKAARSARAWKKRQAARAAEPLRFVEYRPPAAHRSTGITEQPPSYFPPGEVSTTEVEQLPPLNPGLEPWAPSTLEVLPVEVLPVDDIDEPQLKSTPDVSNEPVTHRETRQPRKKGMMTGESLL